MFTIAQKSKLKRKKFSIKVWHVNVAPFGMEIVKGNSKASQPHRALLGPTASYPLELGRCTYSILAPGFNAHFKHKQIKFQILKHIPTPKVKSILFLS